MRRKSERVKDKDKSAEKKSEKAPKKSRRSSRRRKKSSSSSPEESETDEYDTSFKSCKDDTEEEHSSSSRSVHGKGRVSHTETNSDTSALGTEAEEKEFPHVVGSRTRRHSKKQSADEVEEKPTVVDHEVDNKDEKGKEAEPVTDTSEKHKDSESKSSVWQVKSTDCSDGEIKKLKLCIVRPPEPTEAAPRKRKKLSRMSHRDPESAGSAHEVDDQSSHDSPDEKRKSRKSARNLTDEANFESSEVVELAEKKTKAEVSSEDEQKEDISISVPMKVSVDAENEQEDKESSLDESTANKPPVESKEASDPFDELTKKTKIPDKLHEQINSPTNNNMVVDSTRPRHSVMKLHTSQGPLDNLQAQTVETKLLEDQPVENVLDSVESKIPDNAIKLPSKIEIVVSSKETNDNVFSNVEPSGEKVPEVCKPMPEKIKSDKQEEASTIPESPEAEKKVCNLPDNDLCSSAAVDVNIPENVSKSCNASVEKSGESPACKDHTGKKSKGPVSSENKTTIHKSSAKMLTSHDTSPAKSKTRHSSDGSSRDGDSEEERLSHHKQCTDKKRSIHLNRSSSDSRHKTRVSDEEMPVSLKESKTKLQPTDESYDLQSVSKHTNKSKSASKDTSEETSRLERRKYKIPSNQGSVETTGDKPQVREKISLKRSTSYAIYPTSTPNVTEGVVIKIDNERMLQDGENENQSAADVSVKVTPESAPQLTRKRRWRASQTTITAGKKPTMSISSDSLKHLIPEAKPLAISEVQLTEDEDDEEEGEVVSEKVREPLEKELGVGLDLNKHRDEILSSKLIEEQRLYPSPTVPDPPESNAGTVRKISLMSSDAARLQRSPSPARHRVSNVLFVTNLVRPFTVNQLKELLARTGHIQNDGFWIDKIKSKCYVQFETETEARETRHALHGVRWPVSNPKQLCVDYAKKEDMDLAKELSEGNHIPRKTEPLKIDRNDGWLTDQGRDKEREPVMREEREREKPRTKEKNILGSMDILEKSRVAKMAMSVREWDLGKVDLGQFDDRGFQRDREQRSRERERRMRKERSLRSPSPRELPARKVRKKEEDAPAKLLDDLFKKTKITPCVYWLPLTADQIVVKEEMRRKHMAEHERRMAEMRKAERERQRGRMQGRTSQRRFDDRDREKRKHRSLSGSPKK